MRMRLSDRARKAAGLAIMSLVFLVPTSAPAVIDGVQVTGPITLTAQAGHIQTPDGGSYLFWGYAQGSNSVQYPGPTLIVDQGTTMTINLANELAVPVSIVFPGQDGVVATGGALSQTGLITTEALPGGSVTYTFTADRAGTYLYHSGTRPELELEMGLVGTLIVRPVGYNPGSPTTYGHSGTSYDREYLFLLSEMDPVIHDVVESDGLAALDSMDYFSDSFPVYWFINGRAGPDTLLPALPPSESTQPYNCVPRMHPGERLLLRVLGAGKYLHPFHHHGNHSRVIARNGRLLESTPGAGPDLSTQVFTIQVVPGETIDAIFEWTGKGLGWDIYGTGPEHPHGCISASCPDTSPADGHDDGTGSPCYDDLTKEYCPDHGKPLPVTLPDVQQLTPGAFYSGGPFMGVGGFLPPNHTSFNPNAGFAYIWHSHTEKELVNFNIFPGGMLTMLMVEPQGVSIP